MVAFSKANQQLNQMVNLSSVGSLGKAVSEAEKKLEATGANYKFKSADAKNDFQSLHHKDKSIIGKTYAYIAPDGKVYKGHFGWSDQHQQIVACSDGEA